MSYGTPYPITFTSREEIERQVSADAVNWHTDHQSDDELIMEEEVQRATGTVKSRLNKLFSDIHLSQSPWIRHRCTIIACHNLSIKRGNSSIYESQYFQILEEFVDLLDGELFLEELPRQAGASVVMQNIHTDNRYPFTPIRTDVISSSEIVANQINLDRWSTFTWF